jgi:predicted nuclease of predicted toxin-antitoxin system
LPPRLLLDAHLSQSLADALGTHGVDAMAAQQDEVLAKIEDEELLQEAYRLRRVVVTYNVQDFDLIARSWAEIGRHHWGIILIHSRSIPQQDLGGQLRALVAQLQPLQQEDALQDQTVYLTPVPRQ